MKRFLPHIAFLVFLILGGSSIKAFACSCYPTAPCQNLDSADTVFVGRAVGSKHQQTVEERSVNIDINGSPKSGDYETVTYDMGEIYFEVEESFRGTRTGDRITVFSSMGGGDCGFRFRHGESYVVFATREGVKAGNDPFGAVNLRSQMLEPDPSRLWTSLCSGTEHMNSRPAALAYLRNLPKKGSGAKILGSVFQSAAGVSGADLVEKPMIGVRVRARRVSGSRGVFYGQTDADGKYEINVPPGRYQVAPEIGSNLTFRTQYEDRTRATVIADTKCDVRNFVVSNDSQISGRLIGHDGRPVRLAMIELIPADPDRAEKSAAYESDFSSESDGSFSFQQIPPGRYLLGLNYSSAPDDQMPFPTTFYRKTANRSEAQILEIGPGTKIRNLVFQLPPKLVKRDVVGTVVRGDGLPVFGAEVGIVDVESGEQVSAGVVLSDIRGGFKFSPFEGRKYRIEALVWQPVTTGGAIAVEESVSQEFILSATTAPFRLIMTKVEPEKKLITRSTVRAN